MGSTQARFQTFLAVSCSGLALLGQTRSWLALGLPCVSVSGCCSGPLLAARRGQVGEFEPLSIFRQAASAPVPILSWCRDPAAGMLAEDKANDGPQEAVGIEGGLLVEEGGQAVTAANRLLNDLGT